MLRKLSELKCLTAALQNSNNPFVNLQQLGALQIVRNFADEAIEEVSLNTELLRPKGLDALVPVEDQKLLRVAVLGAPNAGKSTLVNHLIGCKIAAVSNKTNTTHRPTLGQFSVGNTQVALFDTPGIIDSRHAPDHNSARSRRVQSAWKVTYDCDVSLFIMDVCRQLTKTDPRIYRTLQEYKSHFQDREPPPINLVLNKIDKIDTVKCESQIQYMLDKIYESQMIENTFLISAFEGTGIDPLKDYLISKAVPTPWILDPHEPTDLRPEELVCEMVREKLFIRMRQELPYEIDIECFEHQSWTFNSIDNHVFRIKILTPSDTTRKMVVGKGGDVITKIRIAAQADLHEIFQGSRVHLYLHVGSK